MELVLARDRVVYETSRADTRSSFGITGHEMEGGAAYDQKCRAERQPRQHHCVLGHGHAFAGRTELVAFLEHHILEMAKFCTIPRMPIVSSSGPTLKPGVPTRTI